MARMFRVNHIVCASSSSVYGVREHGLFSEDDAIEYQTSIYGVTKRFGELLGYVYHRLYDMSITNLRFFTVYGPRARIDMAPFIFMDALHHNKIITIHGDGSAIRDFTYVRDIVNGIVKAIDRPLGYQILNLGRGEPIILSDFIATMENIVGKKACIHYGPEYMSDVPITHANISKAKDLLDYQPLVSIHAGLQHMYDWYKNEYLAITCKKKCNSPENNIVVCHI
jgi:UDP-glucuronate 4-epimerase